MSLVLFLQLAGGVLLLAANAFFVAIEFALTRLRQYDGDAEVREDPRLQQAWEMTEKLEIHLTGCQVGITSTSILLGVIAEPGVTKLVQLAFPAEQLGAFSSHSISIVISLIIINFAHTVWGEQAPTYLGVERAKQVARYCARPLHWWTIAIYPILKMGDWLTKATLRLFGIEMTRSWTDDEGGEGGDEKIRSRSVLKEQMADLVQSGGLSEERQQEVIMALEMEEIPVKDIMIPREEASFLSTSNSLDENLAVIRESMKNRYPLVRNGLDQFLGLLYTPEILARIGELQNGDITLEDLEHYDMTVPAQLHVSGLIDRFQSNKQEMALVKEDDKIVGLVTLTDALEVIVGSAQDPIDQEDEEEQKGVRD